MEKKEREEIWRSRQEGGRERERERERREDGKREEGERAREWLTR